MIRRKGEPEVFPGGNNVIQSLATRARIFPMFQVSLLMEVLML